MRRIIKKILSLGGTYRAREAVPTRHTPQPRELLHRGDMLMLDGDFGRALNYYDEALESDPVNLAALVGKAKASDALGYRGDALRLYRKVLEQVPDHPEALHALRFTQPLRSEGLTEDECAAAFPAFSLPVKFNPEIRAFIDSKAAPNLSTIFCDNNLIRFQGALSFLSDPALVRAVRASSPNGSLTGIWRAHVLAWAARQALRLEGDFVELGVHAGFSAACVYELAGLAQTDRTFFLYDSFSGLAERDPADHSADYYQVLQENYRNPSHYERVQRMFSGANNVKIVVGLVPDTLHREAPTRVAYLHIDLNAAKPEIEALDFFWERLSQGACIILDDFGSLYLNQNRAHAEYMAKKGLTVLELPTGQGLVVKN